ncbi:hypothetical protein THASP1DRAFT_22648 [Thamnocephalis sphaerospora]|uniref:Retrotransposon gag domain-containing protein n=1 Tax=Thamnocephalis sphaerospora TaxID=78915 RepID=A0A4V1IX20_9FUNG|nr:hypothetical protein THASP1DRAFT_22648 [Thamnocephalis sphaerospora]|eukprot:RKP09529.1 hypothetical protein THASP1DRAFT_22648 [Thamnocephalis sphaerospora]
MSVFRDLGSHFPRFGGRSDESVRWWCRLVDDVFSIGTWSDKEKLVIPSLYLDGVAARWYHLQRNSDFRCKSWRELRDRLVATFGAPSAAPHYVYAVAANGAEMYAAPHSGHIASVCPSPIIRKRINKPISPPPGFEGSASEQTSPLPLPSVQRTSAANTVSSRSAYGPS